MVDVFGLPIVEKVIDCSKNIINFYSILHTLIIIMDITRHVAIRATEWAMRPDIVLKFDFMPAAFAARS